MIPAIAAQAMVRALPPGTQFLRPDSNISTVGDVTGGYADIDEVTPNDSDYIDFEDGSSITVGLSNPSGTPSSGGPVRFRVRRVGAGTPTLTVELYEGATLRDSAIFGSLPLSFSDGTWASVDFSAVTNYNDLRLRFSVSGGELYISWAEVEVS